MRLAINLRLAYQAVAIKVSANLVVQYLTRIHVPEPRPFDWQQVIEFAFYGFFGSQSNNIIQFILEDLFPTGKIENPEVLPDILGHDTQSEEKRDDDSPTSTRPRRWFEFSSKVDWRNILAKVILDQTICLFISACIFLICTNIARVSSPYDLLLVLYQKLWPLLKAGWHIWPLVALCNFLWVPVRHRVLVAVIVGFGWSIFLSVFASRK